jgi:hypothetical protein
MWADHRPLGARSLRFSFTTPGANSWGCPGTGSIRLGGMTREQVLAAIITRWGDDQDFTTRDVAAALGAPEHGVRGAMTWLRCGRLIEVTGTVQRVDRKDRPYRARTYKWTGLAQIRRVGHDSRDRRLELVPAPGLAGVFLSRRW